MIIHISPVDAHDVSSSFFPKQNMTALPPPSPAGTSQVAMDIGIDIPGAIP